MKKQRIFLPAFIFLMTFLSCSNKSNNLMTSIIPQPVSMEVKDGAFRLNNSTQIISPAWDENLNSFLQNFDEEMGMKFGIRPGTKPAFLRKNKILIEVDSISGIPREGYKLSIGKNQIKITASSGPGIFYALQTVKQLLYLNASEKEGEIFIPLMEITDFPRFGWRGMLLDVSRHFMTVAEVKKYLDYMAFYKFNKFHWHLTDDQGWRIEIGKYPLLTEIGAWRDETVIGHNRDTPRKYDGKRHGGFYTQEEIREIVNYASGRCIEVIPEIEMPGHARAAIASYPWLGVTGEKIGVKTEWGVCQNIYMPSEETFAFLENVLTEVMTLFPSEYIHIGGDEAVKDQWEASKKVQKLIAELNLKDEHELQSYFIHRIEEFLNKNGKKLIGWDEILEGGLAPNATVMSWRGEKGGIAAARMGHDVIMSPNTHCYFDYYQAEPKENEPLAIGGFLPIAKVYSYNPVPDSLNSEEKKHILGAQANVWTEYIPDFRQVEYMIFPRMLAMAEVTWTSPDQKDMEEFAIKVNDQEKILKQLGVNYSLTGMPELLHNSPEK